MLIHTLFFWLKDECGKDMPRKLVEDCHAYLAKIPSVRQLWAGPPAATPSRPVLDATYDVGLTVVFDDIAGHDVYQEHPLHNEFLARQKQYWKRVQVYDFA
jgi:hypothetical protein